MESVRWLHYLSWGPSESRRKSILGSWGEVGQLDLESGKVTFCLFENGEGDETNPNEEVW